MIDALSYRSWLQPLLHIFLVYLTARYPCYTLIVEVWVKCLALLRPVEVGWFPVTYELYVVTWITFD
jgi:hypothetical protein